MKKRFLVCIVLVIALMTALLAGCGGSGGKKVESGKEATKEQIEDAKVKVEKLIEVENAARNLSATSEAAGKKSNMHWQGKVGTTLNMEQDGATVKLDYYITSDEIIDFTTEGVLRTYSHYELTNMTVYEKLSAEMNAMIEEAKAQGIEPPIYEGKEFGVKSTLDFYIDTSTGMAYFNYHSVDSSDYSDPYAAPKETVKKICTDFSLVADQAYSKLTEAVGSQLSLEEILNAIVGENNRVYILSNGDIRVKPAFDDSYFKNVVYELDFIDDNNYKATKTFTMTEPGMDMDVEGELSITPTQDKATEKPADYETYQEVSFPVFQQAVRDFMNEFSV